MEKRRQSPLASNILCLILLLLTPAVHAKLAKVFTLTSPDGKTEEINSKAPLKDDSWKEVLPEQPSDLCQNRSPQASRDTLETLETQLELETLLQELKNAPKPRSLNLKQKVFLSQVPPCPPFLTELMVISRLLSGYDLVSNKKK